MTDSEYHKLLCDVIRHDSCSSKARILELLSRSRLITEKTAIFAGKPYPWDTYREYVFIETIPANMVELTQHKEYLRKMISTIYPVGNDYKYVFYDFEIKPGCFETENEVTQDIFFNDIEQQIIDAIRTAKYTIWVAMAWFTNQKLFNELKAKKEQGINVQVIIDDNERNKSAPFVLEKEFETQRVRIESYYKNVMHDKFCIIDLQTVIHGTFNWTNAANYNKETISIDSNVATAKAFADEFIKLKTHQYDTNKNF